MKIPRSTEHGTFLGLVLIASPFVMCGQQEATAHAKKYQQYLSEAHARGQFNGNVLVVEHGELVYQGSFGIKSIHPTERLDLNSAFRLASVSKQFTAMAIMILKEQGKLRYDQDVRDFIPELPYEGITIRHLLNHVSGLPDYNRLMDENWRADLNYNDPERLIAGNEDCIRMLAEKKPPLRFKAATKWEYSNTGYMLLGTIVARASGSPYATFLRDHVFGPAGMTHSVVYNYVPEQDPQMPDRVFCFNTGWSGRDTIADDIHYLNPSYGDDGVYTTVGDLLKWDRILYTDKLVSTATREEAFTPAVLSDGAATAYGFGWFIERTPDRKKVVHHSGGWLGFNTNIRREIDENNLIVVLVNNSTRYFWNIEEGLEHILHDEPYELPRPFIRDVMGELVYKEGVAPAIVHYTKLKLEHAADYIFEEQELNVLGYQLLWAGRKDDGAAILRLNMEAYPGSANVYDSYGDALLAKGDTTNALIHFKKALAMDPSFVGTKEKIEKVEAVPATR